MHFDTGSLWEVFPRGLISLIVLFVVTKVLGKKQISQLSMFDYVIGISIGNFAAEITINTDVQLINGVAAVILFGLVAIIISKLTMKSIIIRKMVTGTPTILVEHGNFIYNNMKKTHFDINDFLEECRENGYFDVSQIEYAVLEANGKISFLPKCEYKPLTIKDMNIKTSSEGLCANIIIDGNIMKNNLKNINKDEEWLIRELKIKGYRDYKNILLATLDINDKLQIYDKIKQKKSTDILE